MPDKRTPIYYHDPTNPPWQDPSRGKGTLSHGGNGGEKAHGSGSGSFRGYGGGNSGSGGGQQNSSGKSGKS
ncbi:hypothetical protein CGRA01v4_10375 [Colletotrichum graminicola]|nr:hypothetical protein CGRA01v4_10375 [Colletotrichum graminicola]